VTSWSVVEFDEHHEPLHRWVELDETTAREHFEWVTTKRGNRSDVIRRSCSAALLHGVDVIEARALRRSRRAPFLANRRLEHLDPDTRERIVRLEVLGVLLAKAATRRDGTPRRGPWWPTIRAVACELWTLTRGHEAAPHRPGDVPGWWMAEWTCRCTQVERVRADLPDRCPYHDADPIPHSPQLVEDSW
jgi:hypothetical protein